MKGSVENKILVGFVASVVALGLIGWLAYRTTNRFITTDRMVAHSHEVIATLESGRAMLADTEARQRAFLLTGDDQFLKDSQAAQAQISEWIGKIRTLTADNPEQQRRLVGLASVIAQRMAVLRSRIKLRQEGGVQAVSGDVATLRQGEELMDQVWQDIAQMRDSENRLLSERREMARASAQTSLMIILAGSALACAVGLAAILLIRRDLRLRKQVEEERDRFFDLSRDVICIAAFDGYFKTLNPAWERTLGFSREELMAKPFLEFVHPDDVRASQAEVEKLAGGMETVNFENRFRCRDGSWRWFAWNARAAVPQLLIYAAGRDITEQKRAQAQITRLHADLQNRATQLEVANKELEAFSYSVSHDLRAPLRHIDGFVKLLNKQAGEKLDERGCRYLDIIGDSARQMGALIDDLLIFSRMSRTELQHSRVSLDALVHEAIHGLQSETNNRPIRWKIAPLPEVEADPAMLRQVWVNLIANAIKYSRPRNPAEIEIGCNSDNGELVFFVRDNGVGFDMQYAHKLFGVFQRLHRAEEFEGTGIGLANVRRIVHRHGGRTWAEGQIDRGATFFFSLPNSPETKG
ncbi:MAG TPA: CHASE3 domain-containing protein [Candidatus Sulfopaludibacter sp.]|nr:CHASE3 domain-containing protein [Candidatus Sulfopaludibacter sp.]